MPIHKEDFGQLPNGQTVHRYTLSNNRGLTLKAINYGGIITELHVPDRNNRTADVVLGLSTLEEYLAGHPYFGALVGRVAGRITGARFTLDGTEYLLACNNPPNHLHGGLAGFDKKIWATETTESIEAEPCLMLTCHSNDGEEGYPGNVAITVTYTLTRENELRIEYAATADQPTPLSMTNHSYFNLAGEGSGNINNHLLQIHAHEYVPADGSLTLTGKITPVIDGINDLTRPTRLATLTGAPLEAHGDNYMINHQSGQDIVPVATVTENTSGRVMDVSSNATCLQFYTGKFLDQLTLRGKSGCVYKRFDGFCLECHGYPDGVNSPEIDDIILRPGKVYQQTTLYRFSIAGDSG